MNWKLANDPSIPKDGTLLIVWDKRMLRGKGCPRIAGWFESSTTYKMCWMDFWTLQEVEFTHWCTYESPESN